MNWRLRLRSADDSTGSPSGLASRVMAARRAHAASASEIVDAILDREIDPTEAAEALDAIRGDAAAMRRFTETQRMLDELRRPTPTPDLSGVILAEVGRRRGWLPAPMQRWITAGRLAAAACVVLTFTAVFVARRVAPEAAELAAGRTSPLTRVVSTTQSEATDGFRNFAGVVGSFKRLSTFSDAPGAPDGAPSAINVALALAPDAPAQSSAPRCWKRCNASFTVTLPPDFPGYDLAPAAPVMHVVNISAIDDASIVTASRRRALLMLAAPQPERAPLLIRPNE